MNVSWSRSSASPLGPPAESTPARAWERAGEKPIQSPPDRRADKQRRPPRSDQRRYGEDRPPLSPTSILATDFDGDGEPDIALGSSAPDPAPDLLILFAPENFFSGSIQSSFSATLGIDFGPPTQDLAAADLNADGIVDFVMVDDSDGIRVMLSE